MRPKYEYHYSKSYEFWYRQEPVLEIDGRKITREQLVREFRVPNFKAAKNLDKFLKEHQMTGIEDLIRLGPDGIEKEKGIGERTIFVAASLVWKLGRGR